MRTYCRKCGKIHNEWPSLEFSSPFYCFQHTEFQNYADHYLEPDHQATYFGYLSNMIPGYADVLSVAATIHANKGMERPQVIPHDEHACNPFVRDFYEGISSEDVKAKIRYILGK